MKMEYINPFIDAIYNLFTTMIGIEVQKGAIGISKDLSSPYDVTALIGLSGRARGTVSLSFPSDTAMKMVGKMLSVDPAEMDIALTDGVGEIVNIVAGSAKSKLVSDDGKPIDLSLPNVIIGEDYIIEYPKETVWIEVPFTSELGPFNLRVTFETDK